MPQSHQRNADAAIIGGVLPQGELAIQLQIIHRYKTSVLVGNTTGALFKFLPVLLGPPVAQVSLGIELASLVVEAVGQLVPDHCADASEVHGVIHSLVKKWRLQNPRGKNYFISRAAVVGIHRRRRHAPFFAIERLVDFGNLPPRFEFISTQEITDQVAALHAQLAVVAPHVGITDFVADSIQLQLCLLLGLFRHPGQTPNILIQRFFQRIHHLQHALLAIGAECQLDIFLA